MAEQRRTGNSAPGSPLVQFRAGDLLRDLRARGDSPSLIAKRDLERYYHLLRRSLDEIDFRPGEAAAIAFIVAASQEHHPLPAHLIQHTLWVIVHDAIDDFRCSPASDELFILFHLGSSDRRFLVPSAEEAAEQLRSLSLTHALAVVDAAERFLCHYNWEIDHEDAYEWVRSGKKNGKFRWEAIRGDAAKQWLKLVADSLFYNGLIKENFLEIDFYSQEEIRDITEERRERMD